MKAYLSLGSNIRPAKNIPRCLKNLKENFLVQKLSSVYATSPVRPMTPLTPTPCERLGAARTSGRPPLDQAALSPKKGEGLRVRGTKNFWNLAVKIETGFSRRRLQAKLRQIESKLGRIRKGKKFSPRPIDIDLVLYGNWKRVGFERMAFALFPLAEIAPRLKPAGTKRSLSRLAQEFYDPEQKIRKIKNVFL